MNLDQIATKCFILALFIRDDGQRLLLGDGYYDFNQKLQHFQGNTIANDIVEIQGDSGQLLAGQVMRSGAQKFEGYIGDATTSRQTIEQKRSDFMAFFRIKHFYKVVYIFPDGTAIQRQRGYLTDAPTIPEIFQKFPEYSVALNFEDANYYEYAEDEHGDEIYAHIAELALAGGATGGLIWDAIGAVSNGISWSGIQTAQGEYISITNALDIPAKLASVEILGNAEQDGTPTPDAPVAVDTVTGENVVKIDGKNLCYRANLRDAQDIEFYFSGLRSRTFTLAFTTNETLNNNSIYLRSVGNIQWHNWGIVGTVSGSSGTRASCTITLTEQIYSELQDVIKAGGVPLLMLYKGGANFQAPNDAQLELGSTATAYEPYQGQEFEVNLGKNLLDLPTTYANTGIKSYNIFLPAGTYTLSFADATTTGSVQSSYFRVYDDSSTDLATKTVGYADKKWTFTISKPSTKFAIYAQDTYVGSSGVTTTFTNLQLEKGSQATSYSAYFTPIELAKIGTYQDRIYKDDGKWYIHRAVRHISLPIADMNNSDSYPGWQNVDHIRADLGTGLNTQLYTIAPRMDNIDDGTKNFGINTGGNGATLFTYNGTAGIFGAKNQTTIKTDYPNLVMELYYGILEANQYDEEITNETLIAQLEALGASSLYVGVNNIGTETQNAVPTLKIEYYTEVDLDGAGYEWEPGGNTAKTIVTVAGVDSAWPIWTVQGGAQNPTLTNITTGQTITWQGFVPEGQTLTINMAEMTADLAGANVFEFITGEWIRLAPGNNTLVYTAGNADKPSTLSWNGVLA